jgi:methylthioribose-1-phosphate isomerase
MEEFPGQPIAYDMLELKQLLDISSKFDYDTKEELTVEEKDIVNAIMELDVRTLPEYNIPTDFGMTVGILLVQLTEDKLFFLAKTGKALTSIKEFGTDYYRSLPKAPNYFRKLAVTMAIKMYQQRTQHMTANGNLELR